MFSARLDSAHMTSPSAAGEPHTAKVLYHGSLHKIDGPLRPGQPHDRAKTPDNMRYGVYASHKRNVAIAVALCKATKGIAAVNLLNRNERRPPGELWYGRLPDDGTIYLYTLDSDSFEYRQSQWVSINPVTPVRCEVLRIRDHLHLVRKLPLHESIVKLSAYHVMRLYNRARALLRRVRHT